MAAKADVTEGLYCGNFRFGTLSISNCELNSTLINVLNRIFSMTFTIVSWARVLWFGFAHGLSAYRVRQPAAKPAVYCFF